MPRLRRRIISSLSHPIPSQRQVWKPHQIAGAVTHALTLWAPAIHHHPLVVPVLPIHPAGGLPPFPSLERATRWWCQAHQNREPPPPGRQTDIQTQPAGFVWVILPGFAYLLTLLLSGGLNILGGSLGVCDKCLSGISQCACECKAADLILPLEDYRVECRGCKHVLDMPY